MSYINPVEAKARSAFAITALNNLRHKIEGRPTSKFSDSNKKLLLESIELNESKKLTSKMLIYSFHGIGKLEGSPSIQISEALKEGFKLEELKDSNSILMTWLKTYLNQDTFESPNAKEKTIKLIKAAINYISQNSQDDVNQDSIVKVDL